MNDKPTLYPTDVAPGNTSSLVSSVSLEDEPSHEVLHSRKPMSQTVFEFARVTRSAVLSLCGRYRYALARIWDHDLPQCGWIMLNPSTADADVDDPTIRRCMSFARDWGFGGIHVRNLFAFRATDPNELKQTAAPIEEVLRPTRNSGAIEQLSNYCDQVVLAWGAHGAYLHQGAQVTRQVLCWGTPRAVHLGLTKSGQPKHPLYLKKTLRAEVVTVRILENMETS